MTPSAFAPDASGESPCGFTYLATAYRNVDEVLRLARGIRLRVPEAEIVLVWNGRLDPVDEARVSAAGVRRVGSGRPSLWGSYDLVERVLEGMAEVDPDRWVAVVTSDSYPLGDLGAWQRMVLESGVDAVIRGAAVGDDPMLRARVQYRWVHWRRPSNAVGEFAYRVANKLAALVGPRRRLRATAWSIAVGVRRRKSPPAVFVCGDSWYAIGPTARGRMLELAARPDTDDLFRTTLIPDESQVHTLAMVDGWKVLASPVMHTVWPYDGSPHPRELGPADLEMLEGSEAPFARKVTGDDGAELARLLDVAYEGSSAGA